MSEKDNNQEYPKPQNDDQSTSSRSGRRQLLRNVATLGGGMAVGARLPDKWHRPVVESILLPAHAQTTGEAGDGASADNRMFFGGGPGFVSSYPESEATIESVVSHVADFTVGAAHAHGDVTFDSGCVRRDGNNVDVEVVYDDVGTLRTLTGSGLLEQEIPLQPVGGSIEAASIYLELEEYLANTTEEMDNFKMNYDITLDVVDHEEDFADSGTWDQIYSPC